MYDGNAVSTPTDIHQKLTNEMRRRRMRSLEKK